MAENFSELETDKQSNVAPGGSDLAVIGIVALVMFAAIGFMTTCGGVVYGLYKIYTHVFP